MTKSLNISIGSLIFLLNLIIVATPVKAAEIAISNSGFEEPSLAGLEPIVGEEIFTFTTPPGWQLYDPNGLIPADTNLATSYPGVWNPSPTFFADEAPEGENIGAIFLNQALNSGVVGFTQTLANTLQANTEYTLKVEVGNPGSDFFAGFPGYGVQLLAGNTIIAEDNNTLAVVEGEFNTTTISFTTTTKDLNLGEPLQIRLLNTLESTGLEVNFDNIRLSANPVDLQSVPESNSIWSLLILAIGLFFMANKFRVRLLSSHHNQ